MRKNIIYILGFLALTFSTSSCLKDDLGEDWTDSLAGKMYAQIVSPGPGFRAVTIAPLATDQIITVGLNIASDAAPGTASKITVAFDPAALEAYNAKQYEADTNNTMFELYPTMEIVTPEITIPAGSKTGSFEVKLKGANLLDPSTSFMVPITITNASTGIVIASNFKTTLISVPIANEWEGSYASTGRIHKETAWDRTWTSTKHMSTVNATTVNYSAADIGTSTNIEVNPTTYAVVSMTAQEGSNVILLNTPELNIDGQGGVSRYDKATKTFYLYYYYIGSGNLYRAASEICVKK